MATGRKRIGETEQDWYLRAKGAVAEYDALIGLAPGRPADFPEMPAPAEAAKIRCVRDALAETVGRAEERSPTDYGIFADPWTRRLTEALETWIRGSTMGPEAAGTPAGGALGRGDGLGFGPYFRGGRHMRDLRMAPVMIAGNSPKQSLFAMAVSDGFGFHASLNGPSLGQQPGEEIYNLAKREVAKFDALVERTKRIANKTVRDDVIDEFGLTEPDNKDKALYARNVTEYEIRRAESYTPVNTYIFTGPGPAKNRPGRLEDWNDSFERAVRDAEITYGILPEPVIIERLVAGAPGATVTPGWVVPALGIAAAAVGAALLGVFD